MDTNERFSVKFTKKEIIRNALKTLNVKIYLHPWDED
jgi:hypothetical protein